MNDDDRLEAHAIVEQLFLRIQVDTEKAITEARELGERLRVTFEANQDARGLCKLWRLRALVHWLEGRCLAADAAWEKAAEYAGEIGDDRERAEILMWVASSAFYGPTPVGHAIRRCEAIRDEVRRRPAVRGSHLVSTRRPVRDDRPLRCGTRASRSGLPNARGPRLRHPDSSFTQYDGLVELLAGDLARAEERLRFGLGRLEEMGERAFVSTLAALLAEVLYRRAATTKPCGLSTGAWRRLRRTILRHRSAWRTVQAKLLATAGHWRTRKH